MINAEALIQVYLKRPDLQAVYNADGSKKDPKNPAPPTLMDWANTFGVKEELTLDPRNETLLQYYSPEEVKAMPDDIKTGLSAFVDVQKKNFESGLANADINAKTWADALNAASQDPDIAAKYGDELKIATESTNRALETLAAGYTDLEAKQARDMELQRKNLQEVEAAAGRAYSGFRTQAEDRLKKEQGEIVRSSKRQIKEAIQNVVAPSEQRFGTSFIDKLKIPTIGGQTYDAFGEIKGSVGAERKADERNLAADFYETTKLPQ